MVDLLKNEINNELIGGIRVKVGTKVMDASVQNDLAQLEKKFKNIRKQTKMKIQQSKRFGMQRRQS